MKIISQHNIIACIIFVLTFAIMFAIGNNRAKHMHPIGDEPHYLIIAKSMVDDGDFALANNYADKDYTIYGYVEIGPHTARTSVEGKGYSVHNIGLPILIYIGYLFGEFCGSIVIMNLFASLAALFIFLLSYKITKNYLKSVICWTTIFLVPMTLFANAIFTEMPLFCISTILLFLLYSYSQKPKTRLLLIASVLLSILVWLHVKYIFIAGSFILAFILIIKANKLKNIFMLCFLPVLSCLAELLLFKQWFGAMWFTAQYSKADLVNPTIWTSVLQGTPGLFIDKSFGLFLFSPIFILSFAGAYFLYKKNKSLFYTSMIIFVINLLAFSSYVKLLGFGPVGRFIMPVMSIMVFWLIYFISTINLKKSSAILFYILSAVSLFFAIFFMFNFSRSINIGYVSKVFEVLPIFPFEYYHRAFPVLIGKIETFDFPVLDIKTIIKSIFLFALIILANLYYIKKYPSKNR